MLRPLNDQVVVEPVKAQEISLGGVALPEDARDSYAGLRGLVVAVGPGPYTIQGARLTPQIKPGDVVILARQGLLIRDGGKVYCLVGERDILAVVEGSAAHNSVQPARVAGTA